MSYTLHTPAGNFRAFKILIAAEYNGIDIDIPEFDAAKAGTISPTGKAPVLETPEGAIFESGSIARYISKLSSQHGLLGKGFVEEAMVDQWIDFCANKLELPACVWWYPVAGYMPFQKAANDKAKADLAAALDILNKHLEGKEFIANSQVTLADITIASALVYPFKLVCDGKFLKPYANVTAWFKRCVEQDQFKAVIGEVAMCKKECKAKGQ